MGRVKELLLEKEEKDWIEAEQSKILSKAHHNISMKYNDLLQWSDIKRSKRIYIDMVNGKTYDFTENDIMEMNGLSIKIDYGMEQKIVLPLDKIVSVKYIY